MLLRGSLKSSKWNPFRIGGRVWRWQIYSLHCHHRLPSLKRVCWKTTLQVPFFPFFHPLYLSTFESSFWEWLLLCSPEKKPSCFRLWTFPLSDKISNFPSDTLVVMLILVFITNSIKTIIGPMITSNLVKNMKLSQTWTIWSPDHMPFSRMAFFSN